MYKDIVNFQANFQINNDEEIFQRAEHEKRYKSFDDIIGNSKELGNVLNQSKIVANSPSTILIEGESGTGKEILAQAIHSYSNRSKKTFVAINCGAIPKDLIESELFGYVDGAFTGAKRGGKIGKFELASGGTLFLDEIGEMPLEMQVHLLRVLQEKFITRVGGNKEIKIDVRIIAATNKDLREEVKRNKFREDLFYRLNVIPLTLPPLREREGDINLLIENFLENISLKLGKELPKVDKNLYNKLLHYKWPGNIRELENCIENIVNLNGDICKRFLETIDDSLGEKEEHGLEKGKKGFFIEMNENFNIKDIEKILIEKAIKFNDYNISKTAKELGISRNTLYYKINKYGIIH